MKYSFKTHLLEGFDKNNEAVLVLQKIIDIIDDGHLDYSDGMIKLNVGPFIKDKRYNNLYLIIKQNDNDESKLGKNEDDDFCIFLYTNEVPDRKNIDDFLSKEKNADSFINEFKRYKDLEYKSDDSDEYETEHEKTKSINDEKQFEELYDNMIGKIEKNLEKYETSIDDLKNKSDVYSKYLRNSMIHDMTKENLKKEFLGDNVNEFINKAIDLFGKDKFNALNKDFKEKLTNRLKSYYEQKKF